MRYTTPTGRHMYNWHSAEDLAATGKIPEPPDFSADTHKPYRELLDRVSHLARVGNLEELQALEIYPNRKELSTSPRTIKRYRDLCVRALKVSQSHPPRLNVEPITKSPDRGSAGDVTSAEPLQIAEAKRRLAVTFGVKPEAIEIIIRA